MLDCQNMKVGRREGSRSREGSLVGFEVGKTIRLRLGNDEGTALGGLDRAILGFVVACTVGLAVGRCDGRLLG